MKAPLSVCMIVKNEEGQIGACLQSLRAHVEEICVVDTGSTDATPKIVRELADKFEVMNECNDAEGRIVDFSMARQRSFGLATRPWAMWVDGDDEVRHAECLPELVRRFEAGRNGRPTVVMLPYEYAHDARGNCTCYHFRERLVTPVGAFKWQGPVHEVLVPMEPGTEFHNSEEVTIVHHRDTCGKAMEPGRNLRILRAHYDKVGESDVRQLYYLGLEYGNVGDLQNAIKFHTRYVELSGWDDEKFLACLRVAEHHQSVGQYDEAVQWGMKAMTVREGWGEAYFSVGRSYYFMAQRGGAGERRNWERSVHFIRQGLACPPTKTVLFVNPTERTFEIHKWLNLALNKVGDVKGALESVNTALAVKPDAGLEGNKRLYAVHLAKVQVTESVQQLVGLGEIGPEMEAVIQSAVSGKLQIRGMAGDGPAEAGQVPRLPPVEPRLPRAPGGLDVVFYVGFSCERWNPDTAARGGIGGSETAVIEMSRRLAARGHRVRVFGDCASMEGTFEGVEYVDYGKFHGVECDVLITSRRPHVVDDVFGTKARATLCWVHDVHCGTDLTHARILRIDRFLCLSRWHREFFLNVHKGAHPDQVLQTRNGIDLGRFCPDGAVRDPHRAVYSSSPDRGLEVAMRVWPRVRERVPDAELHVFYGFENWEVAARSRNDHGQIELAAKVRRMLDEHAVHGVVYHGRVDQATLAKEFMQSGVWAYSTWFSESSCITAMEAQAAGLKTVTSPIAALNETVGDRGTMIPGDWLSDGYQAKFVDAVVAEMLKGEDPVAREALRRYAVANFGWDSLAAEWEAMLARVLAEVERDVVPMYRKAV